MDPLDKIRLTVEELKETVPNPIEIVALLDKHIVGQEQAKRTLALMLLNRALIVLRRAGLIDMSENFQKSNVLMIGPTGTGKTALIKALALVSDIPISINDVTNISGAGYVGGKVEDILNNHINLTYDYLHEKFLEEDTSAETNYFKDMTRDDAIERIETGIIYIDEIDKLACNRIDGTKDKYSEEIQNELLKFLEGGSIDISGTRYVPNTNKASIKTVNTSDILFICGGAFVGLEDIIANRLRKGSGIGFGSDLTKNRSKDSNKEDLLAQVQNEDLVNYGFKPEFLGRVPLRASLSPMTVPMLERIIYEPEDSLLKQYTQMFKVFDVTLLIDDGAVTAMAEKAIELRMGARALKSIFNSVLSDQLFDIFNLTGQNLTITEDIVRLKCK